jgi:uncharacterized protein
MSKQSQHLGTKVKPDPDDNFSFRCDDYLKVEKVLNAIELCEKLTATYDESHDYKHHVQVLKNAMNIFNEMYPKKSSTKPEYDMLRTMIFYAAILHDTIDSKYPEGLIEKTKTLETFLDDCCPNESEHIKWIINNMSYSKEKKNGYPNHFNNIVQLARDIVSDADKLEAIGEIGLVRCRQFTVAMNPNASDEAVTKLVVQHCHDKLLLLKSQYIRTPHGKKLAEPRHAVIQKFVDKYSLV